MRRNRSTS